MNTITRRTFLGTAAVATVSAASAALLITPRDELPRLIRAHKAAVGRWIEASDKIYVSAEKKRAVTAVDRAHERAAHDAEKAALRDLLAFRPVDRSEDAARLDYLLTEVWEGSLPEEWELRLFFASMLPGGWCPW